MKEIYTISEVASTLGVSKETLRRWDKSGKLVAVREKNSNYRVYEKKQLERILEWNLSQNKKTDNFVNPKKEYKVLELLQAQED